MENSNSVIREERKEIDICVTSSREQYREKRKVKSKGIFIEKIY
jgi:hypothetical protein